MEIPTGIPLVYRFDEGLNVLPSGQAQAPLRGRFLGSADALAAAQEAVAAQSRLRYSA